MNLFEIPKNLPKEEWTEILALQGDFRIERILSNGQISPEGFSYDQTEDEWVLLMQGRAKIQFDEEDDKSEIELIAGDFIQIPAHKKHHVTYTSSKVPCIWFCIFKKVD